MKTNLILCLAILFLSFTPFDDCGDGNIYANKKQTEYDDRFENFQKINDVPQFKDGEKSLDTLIQSKLKLSDEAKNAIFNLNYQITVTCDGKIKDVKQIGDVRMDQWTNIVEIITGTEGQWQPAKKNGKEVDCIYFDKLLIVGSKYK